MMRCCLIGFGATAILTSGAAAAQPASADLVIDRSLTAESGLALSRGQIAEGDLPGAVATLERVLLAWPAAVAPRLLYASLLCRLDDRQGAKIELDLMRGRPAPDAAWAEVTAACGPTLSTPPAAGGTK
jgi:hypothetical protein